MANLTFTDKKILCKVKTPLQLCAALALFSMKENSNFKTCTLMVDVGIPGIHACIDSLRQAKCFTEVYLCQPYSLPFLTSMMHMIDVSCVTEWRKRRFFSDYPYLNNKSFDVIVTGNADSLAYAIKDFLAPKGYAVFLDDGTGSHGDEAFAELSSLDFHLGTKDALPAKTFSMRMRFVLKRILLTLKKPRLSLNVKELWIFNSTGVEGAAYKIPVRCISITNRFLELLQRLIGESDRLSYKDARCVFLTNLSSGIEESQSVVEFETMILHELVEASVLPIHIRKHPKDFRQYQGLSQWILPTDTPWEILVAGGVVSGNSILVSYFSTASFTTKWIFDLEPWVIFLYKLFPDDGNQQLFDGEVDDLRQRYKAKEKICVPETMDDCVRTLKRISDSSIPDLVLEDRASFHA